MRVEHLKSLSTFIFTVSSISSVQPLSRVWLFATPWTEARQASLSITNSWNLLKLMSIESVMPSNHLTLCHPLLLPPSLFPYTTLFRSPGFPVHHQLLEPTQTHVHWVDDAIQQSHPLSSPSPSALNLSGIRVFSQKSLLQIRWPK